MLGTCQAVAYAPYRLLDVIVPFDAIDWPFGSCRSVDGLLSSGPSRPCTLPSSAAVSWMVSLIYDPFSVTVINSPVSQLTR